MCSETLEASKRVDNSLVGIAAVGLDVDASAAAEARALVAAADAALTALFPVAVSIMGHPDGQVAAASLPFLLTYVARVRAQQKRGVGPSPPQRDMVAGLLTSVAAAACYPVDSVMGPGPPATHAEAAACEEEAAAVAERRQDMMTLFKNCCKVLPLQGVEFVAHLIETVTQPGQQVITWQETEMAITLLYVVCVDAALSTAATPFSSSLSVGGAHERRHHHRRAAPAAGAAPACGACPPHQPPPGGPGTARHARALLPHA